MSISSYFDVKIVGNIQRVIAGPTAKALQEFARQEPEFEQAIEQSEKDFQSCLDHIARKCAGEKGVSDLDVFRAAAQFYFSTADVQFHMKIKLSAGNGAPKPRKETLSVSLNELLDF